ncbi:MAG: hypothetical protein A2815_00140 [Candidatus Portnoybacteria bacterium RIFCSPHIGHO2_01_FULL_40_12b]|uniref:Dipeptidylpeptidase IV N-terminal domain-containing protein n=1 Tax=Candidatus Portnoybacteria bacterium RIFCSPHIGHO2_01_FULL_40_12b TaxID=1801994 RepID=A0A1G2FEF2_9BACT|nr:MAG: hypothetical protein A2815_00140 [Candidatus Portnoybacteria bacterium RIFCSPHIGHO2_01_FULL_40_12b]
MTLKNIFVFLIVLLVLVAGALGFYNFFFKKEALPITEDGDEIKPSTEAKIKIVSQEPVLAPIIDNDKIKYYLKENGNVFQSDFDGENLERISSNILQGLEFILWSPDKTKVIGIFSVEGGKEIKKHFYDYETKESILLNQNIQWISWAPEENKIAYQYLNPKTEDNFISTANPDGSNWKNILKTRIKDPIVEWPAKNQVSIRTKPSGLAQSALYTINSADGDFQKILSDIYGLTALWSPSGEKLLFSETDKDGKNLKLKTADKNGQNIKELNILTWPEKCAWSQDERIIFCAVPRVIPDDAIWPDDYYKGLFRTTDDFYKVNLETNEKSPLIEADKIGGEYDATKIFLSPQEDYLFFVNKKDGLLYNLRP